MPYNKGDFTQQGINGDVSALVRLNEKRVMKVVLSSDDESDNCDISGKVYDLLNGTSYDIGSGVSGNIEITENGENINVAPYATATVNVSGGGETIPKCTMSIVASELGEDLMTKTFENGKIEYKLIPDDNTTVATYLYYAVDYPTTKYAVYFWAGNTIINRVSDTSNVTNLVNITVDADKFLYVIDPTQDSSCTISATEFYEM